MKAFFIRLKDHPDTYIGKKNVSYAFISDIDIKNGAEIDINAHWFVKKIKAKVWHNEKDIKWLYTYGSKYFNNEGKELSSTFSKYEVEIDDNGVFTYVPLDEFIK